MSYDICGICERFYPKDGKDYCPDCRDKDQNEFNILRDYVKQNYNAKVFEASNATGIPINTIMRFVRERRIHLTGGDSGSITFRDK
ncbi:hypothetical protein BHU72_00355 [Desulfuribacillus stibiiarsenatis]|uniref:Flagellar protein n=1 Tax=Desulfuribacillus stibiiarsenatis TaxID=1390249 RepID=A0A1E5L9F5_9FIRM|nr:hypothetical protein [Desulfuribacillus stibiiarsenatis]OEH86761.1 hypothetical protein BHU72_00355 [Desulfuribacillus stibiiarsenatis]